MFPPKGRKMKGFILGVVLTSFLAGGAFGYWLQSSETKIAIDPACVSIRKEGRRVIDLYEYLLSREEIRAEEDRRSIEREYHGKFIAVIKEGEKKGCF